MTLKLAREAAERRRTLITTMTELRALSSQLDPRIRLFGRIKTSASIARKMSIKDLCLDQVMDIIGIRVITLSEVDCYRLVDRIREAFVTVKSEFDDYIEEPKANGYRSIHTTIAHPSGFPVEVQIRTLWMDELCSRGAAAHDLYKEVSHG